MTPSPAELDLDLSIIIVNWNVRDLLRACLVSLRASPGVWWPDAGARQVAGAPALARPGQAGPAALFGPPASQAGLAPLGGNPAPASLSAEVIVVDNGSADDSAAMLAVEFPWVHLIPNPDNRGFTRGNNQGLARSRGRYVLFLNPDTEVVGDALAAMVAYLETHARVGGLGPQLRNADGSLQSSRRRFPTFAMALFESTPLAWHLRPERNHWAQRYHLDDCPPGAEAQQVDWVVGAALLVRRAVLDQIGGFDEGYFMYSEELDWCRRVATAGWHIVYLSAATIVHYEGKSSEQVVAARHIYFQSSKVRYFARHHGPLRAEVLRLFILGSFAGEWLLEAAKWLAGSRRTLRSARLAAYAQLLRSGLRTGR